ncbi:MAG TPA: hypothetical protein VGB99_05365 [Acidobacteriota bacterium]|jgi:hypothetical protein
MSRRNRFTQYALGGAAALLAAALLLLLPSCFGGGGTEPTLYDCTSASLSQATCGASGCASVHWDAAAGICEAEDCTARLSVALGWICN